MAALRSEGSVGAAGRSRETIGSRLAWCSGRAASGWGVPCMPGLEAVGVGPARPAVRDEGERRCGAKEKRTSRTSGGGAGRWRWSASAAWTLRRAVTGGTSAAGRVPSHGRSWTWPAPGGWWKSSCRTATSGTPGSTSRIPGPSYSSATSGKPPSPWTRAVGAGRGPPVPPVRARSVGRTAASGRPGGRGGRRGQHPHTLQGFRRLLGPVPGRARACPVVPRFTAAEGAGRVA